MYRDLVEDVQDDKHPDLYMKFIKFLDKRDMIQRGIINYIKVHGTKPDCNNYIIELQKEFPELVNRSIQAQEMMDYFKDWCENLEYEEWI